MPPTKPLKYALLSGDDEGMSMLSQAIEELSSDDEFFPKKRPARAETPINTKPSAMVDLPSPVFTGTSKRKATIPAAAELSVDEATDSALITPPKSKKRRTANATKFEAKVPQTPTKAPSAVYSKAVKVVNAVAKTAASIQHGKNSSQVADKIINEEVGIDSAQLDATPLKTKVKSHRLQEYTETITKLTVTVQEQASTIAKLTNANAKSVEAEAKLVDSNSKLVKRTAELLAMETVVEAVQRERLLTQREAELQVNEKAAAEQLDKLAKEVWQRQQALRYWEVAIQARLTKLDNAATSQPEGTKTTVYETQNLDIYKTDRISQLPADDPLAKQLVLLWERKVAAVLGNKPLSRHVEIPEEVTNISWNNHPIVHCFVELDGIWQYLDKVAEVCTHLVRSKHPTLLFADQMRSFPVKDAELWLLGAENVLEKLAETFEATEIESKSERIPHGPSTLEGRRQRRFRALKRNEVLSILAVKGDSSKNYRLAKIQAESFAIQEGFDEVF
ncbi:hypothetical protein B0A48_13944 [Cryoendolithus antarcticus]|uniref:Uncharacterized protein n=1 Tax=Cryoendolithus antarcticus TaxID=1507870 RepID=A0A1V8SLX0_9PEZI|nr:hypothetical protein B0A48_13944 [Cryoendolithus antarcticus]